MVCLLIDLQNLMPKLQNSRKTCVFDNIQSDYFQLERINKEVKIRKVRKRVSKTGHQNP